MALYGENYVHFVYYLSWPLMPLHLAGLWYWVLWVLINVIGEVFVVYVVACCWFTCVDIQVWRPGRATPTVLHIPWQRARRWVSVWILTERQIQAGQVCNRDEATSDSCWYFVSPVGSLILNVSTQCDNERGYMIYQTVIVQRSDWSR